MSIWWDEGGWLVTLAFFGVTITWLVFGHLMNLLIKKDY